VRRRRLVALGLGVDVMTVAAETATDVEASKGGRNRLALQVGAAVVALVGHAATVS
jgi:hypothetical protein